LTSTTKAPRGLIMDFGGVLTTSIIESFAAFCRDHGVSPDLLRKAMRASAKGYEPGGSVSATELVEKGHITEDEFNLHIAEALSEGLDVPIDPVGLKARLFGGVGPEPSMVIAVQKIRAAGALTALCSNSWGGEGYPRELLTEIFDAVVISGEVGMRKPDAEIYLETARRIGLPPGECVFVDDFERNVEGATKTGMIGVHHTDASETIARLETLFGVSLNGAG
jgi:putative hydrolase of the HAD superfamily